MARAEEERDDQAVLGECAVDGGLCGSDAA